MHSPIGFISDKVTVILIIIMWMGWYRAPWLCDLSWPYCTSLWWWWWWWW